MLKFQHVVTVVILAACARTPASVDPVARSTSAPAVKVAGGKWFDGAGFAERTVYMDRGMFVERPSREPDSVIDLLGAYVVPPSAEAHNHNFDASSPAGAKAVVAKYMKDGIFYGENPAN